MKKLEASLIQQMRDENPCCSFTEDVPWKILTTIGIGSYAKIVAEPDDDLALSSLLKFTSKRQIPLFPIGSGSDIIGTDEPYEGVILKLKRNFFSKIKFGSKHATVGAGVSLYELAVTCADHGFGGFAKVAGIPGTIGGSLKTNAGRLGMPISDKVVEISGFTLDGEPWISPKKDIKWTYRTSSIPSNVIVCAAIVELEKSEKSAEYELINTYLSQRSHYYPKERSAGCVFKNPSLGHTSGKLIDMAGLKGVSRNGAKISPVHANFIVNDSGTTEKNFLETIIEVKESVLRNFGIYLESEVLFVNPESQELLNNSPRRINVLVLKGGDSHERPVSLESAEGVSKALTAAGYNVSQYDIQTPFVPDELLTKADVVFPVLHGGFGENGEIQRFLEERNVKFVGSDSKASQIIIDKIKTKQIFIDNNIPTAKFTVLKDGDTVFPEGFTLPVVVKAPNEGSTFGVSIVKDMNQWQEALKNAAGDVSGMIMVEEFVEGYELTAGILNGMSLPLVHIIPPCEFYDFDAKYTHQQGETVYNCPPDPSIIPEKIQKEIEEYALQAYKATGARDMARVDALLCKKTLKPYFLELNSIPGFTSSSLLPKAANAVGIPYIQLCGILVQLAFKR